jgi:hypothetical protein
MSFLSHPATSEISSRNELASVWMKRGIALLEKNVRETLIAAVSCFDKAIDLRSTLPLDANSIFRYGLSAGWMNRGDALTRLGSEENLSEALRSYDQTLALLQALPIDENPLYRKRLAIAWLNRGITLQSRKTGSPITAAIHSFDSAINVLQHGNAGAIPERRQMLGSAWMNRANTLLSFTPPDPIGARLSAKEALDVVAEIEGDEPAAAEIGLKARHVLCRALAHLLSERPAPGNEELIGEATDAAEEGLRLARVWERRGPGGFRSLGCDLFRFGARVYQAYQPQFLAEFLLESLDDSNRSPDAILSRETHRTIREIMRRSLAEIQHEGFKAIHTPGFEQMLGRIGDLRRIEERLAGR